MVTKLDMNDPRKNDSSVLAKIHMVTKQRKVTVIHVECSVLAKIHMVTKQEVITK